MIESTGPYPVIGDTVEIKNGQVTVSATEGTAICGSNGVTISGGTVSASTTANMSAIYAESGNIVLDGAGTSVTASSTGDSAIFTRNGAITLNAGNIHATAPEGSAAFTARFSGQSDTVKSGKPHHHRRELRRRRLCRRHHRLEGGLRRHLLRRHHAGARGHAAE